MSSILEEIETKIAGLKTSTTKSNIGTVREAGDGVARIEGLSDVMLNEMIEFPGGVFGLALNLEETEVGAILLGDATKISEGDEAKMTGRSIAFTSRSDRKIPMSHGSWLFWKKRTRCATPPLFLLRLRTARPINISPHSRAQLWASGSWITEWMHLSSMTISPNMR